MVLAWKAPQRPPKSLPASSTGSPPCRLISPRSQRVLRVVSEWQALVKTDPVKAELLLDWNERFLNVKNG